MTFLLNLIRIKWFFFNRCFFICNTFPFKEHYSFKIRCSVMRDNVLQSQIAGKLNIFEILENNLWIILIYITRFRNKSPHAKDKKHIKMIQRPHSRHKRNLLWLLSFEIHIAYRLIRYIFIFRVLSLCYLFLWNYRSHVYCFVLENSITAASL